MIPLPERLRLARVLHRGWCRDPSPDPADRAWTEFEAALAKVRRMQRSIHLALRHGLYLVLTTLRADASRHLAELSSGLGGLIESNRPAAPPPGFAHWMDEVRQLDAEFEVVSVRWPDRVLRVVTEPIVLKDVALGPFAIEFGWEAGSRHRGARAFDVIALEPNPASGRDDVVHPHVDGTRLYAGEAAEPIRNALEQGRLADAFLLVRSVLAHYNPDSPYVPLEHWLGFHCAHCGHRGRSGEARRCEGCNDDLCSDCSDSCSHCSDTRCPGCLESCDACADRCCSGCLRSVEDRALCPDCRNTCPSCNATVARDEIEDDRCPNCAEPEPSEEAACVTTA